ncbi:PEP-CTERM sorting domain-containing protein [Pelobacter propionicus]|uniref:Ice-binding protein C-terminal domain-containing protein n=1 Tax=Pelobacter propionicus (strain DSM 2379 / NBRC 103807 / OttBd1) TaxID=338966 RepID=A1ARR9_PELPD|nr:PEP-CTERM sorting domain-containing protein [Pelobacter propionicus]ABL00040.1 hypothetical protein Ppro_2434 [Pelobacter propionicus DSM 2379]
MFKKLATLLAGAALMLAATSAMATPLNPYLNRPTTVNVVNNGENSLQTELNGIFGAGVVDASADQLGVGMFKIATPGSNVIAPQFKFEWTGNSATQSAGIFGWNGTTAVEAVLFDGSAKAGYSTLVKWNTADSGKITYFDQNGDFISQHDFDDISRDFFGVFFQASENSEFYYSVDSLNPQGEARVLGYEPTLSGAAFAYEDGTDFDYNDAGFFVESIAPVPEPGTMVLLGAGMLGLAIFGKRRMNREA